MCTALVEAREHRACLGGDVCLLVVVACERADVVERVEHRDRGELDLVADLASHQIRAVIAGETEAGDVRQDVVADDLAVGARVLARGPAPPVAQDHEALLPSVAPYSFEWCPTSAGTPRSMFSSASSSCTSC